MCEKAIVTPKPEDCVRTQGKHENMGKGRDWKANVPELRIGAAENSETLKDQKESIGG